MSYRENHTTITATAIQCESTREEMAGIRDYFVPHKRVRN